MNGLQGLMQATPNQPRPPQQARPMPAQNNPRMAAAMDIVDEGVPSGLKALMDKNTFAQKAVALLESAGGQAAMGQVPPPPVPNIVEKVDRRAEEGVMGLLASLSPGIQQRGRQLQTAKARSMMGGGLPTQPANNMMRAAQGGIVGYAKGDLVVGPPEQDRSLLQKVRQGVGQGMMDMGSNMQESDQIIRSKIPFIKQMLDKGPAITPQERAELKAEVEQNPGLIGMFGKQLERLGIYVKGMVGGGIVSLKEGGFPDLSGDGKITRKDILIGSGVIDKKEGGIIGYAEGDLVIDPSIQAEVDAYLLANPQSERPTYPSFEERRENLKAEEAARDARLESEEQVRQQRRALRSQGLPISVINQIMKENPPKPTVISDEVIGIAEGGEGSLNGRPLTEKGFTIAGLTSPPAVSRDGILNNLGRQPVEPPPESNSVDSGDSVRDAIRNLLAEGPELTPRRDSDIVSSLEALRGPTINSLTERLDSEYVDKIRQDITKEAQDAYEVPQEYKDLIEKRIEELDAPFLSDEDAKRRRLTGFLSGLASSNLISQGGPRAAAASAKVQDDVREDSLKRATDRFTLAEGLMKTDRDNSVKAFDQGVAAMQTAMNQVGVATQMAGSMLNSADKIAEAQLLQDRTERLAKYTNQIAGYKILADLNQADKSALISTQLNVSREMQVVGDALENLNNVIALGGSETAAILAPQLQALRSQRDLLSAHSQALKALLLPDMFSTGSGGGGDVIDFTDL